MDNAEEAFQTALDAEGENAETTRLVFADWLQDRNDPRADGYRVLAAQAVYPKHYRHDEPGTHTWRRYEDDPFGQVKSMSHVLPVAWFDALEGAVKSVVSYKTYASRRKAEDAAALAFAKLAPADRAAAADMARRKTWAETWAELTVYYVKKARRKS